MGGRHWSEQEIEKLREVYFTHSLQELAKIFNRTPEAVKCMALKLGLKRRESGRKWTIEDEKLLRKLYATTPIYELAKILNRKPAVISQKAFRIGLRRSEYNFWSKEDIENLKKLYKKDISLFEMTKVLKRSPSAIQRKAFEIGIKHNVPSNLAVNRGVKGEELAPKIFEALRWKIIEKGTPTSPYDFIVQRSDGSIWFINAKYGNRSAITGDNLGRLRKLSDNCGFLYISVSGEVFFLSVEPIPITWMNLQ